MTASLNEPFAGWIDNFNGPTGLLSAMAKGLFRTIVCEENCIADVVPVDIVINLMITAAWRTATHKTNDNLLIYNCCTGQRHPITWGKFVNYAIAHVRKHPLGKYLCDINPLAVNRFVIKSFHFYSVYSFRGLCLVSWWSFTS